MNFFLAERRKFAQMFVLVPKPCRDRDQFTWKQHKLFLPSSLLLRGIIYSFNVICHKPNKRMHRLAWGFDSFIRICLTFKFILTNKEFSLNMTRRKSRLKASLFRAKKCKRQTRLTALLDDQQILVLIIAYQTCGWILPWDETLCLFEMISVFPSSHAGVWRRVK